MGLDLTRVSLGTFRKPVIREAVTIDGKVYAVMEPDQVQGRIEVAPACEPKTDFDAYYKHNLAYFNLFSSAVYDEYLALCEEEIRRQKLQSKGACVGREGLATVMLYTCMIPAGVWIFVVIIRAICNSWHGGS